LDVPPQRELLQPRKVALSIIIPTYNESENIARIIESIALAVPADLGTEVIVVDDNSPDGTAEIVDRLAARIESEDRKVQLKVMRRPSKLGLSSAILAGVQSSSAEFVVVMDGDFSHPPQTIPRMIEVLQNGRCDIVVASRYITGGSVTGWPFRRRLMSRGATKIAQVGLGIGIKDPMSGFFGFRRSIIADVKFDAIGYKMLLEMLVKIGGIRVREIPYTFINRRLGASKVDAAVVFDYIHAVYRLYRHGRALPERRASVRFLSKAGRFYTVGASGLFVNLASSSLISMALPALGYLYATIVGILLSITSNFFLNKVWTFEDRDFSGPKTARQYGLFLVFSSAGALIQLSIISLLVEGALAEYPLALVLGVIVASVGNFLLNKKWTFKEKIWS
jgi:dolichol-phosphate mannosyltransferase